jgi:beta-mannanase
MIGVYVQDGLGSGPAAGAAFESSLGRRIQILSFYEAWGNGRRPDIAGIEACLAQGFVPMITWEPWCIPSSGAAPEEQPDYSLSALVSGRYEAYIRSWADDLSRLSSPIFLRPMHEMNGNWYPWCGPVNGNTPGEYLAAWHYLRSVFRHAGCDSVEWVWSPYAESVPQTTENDIERYYPGGHAVDWLALDGYNWGSTRAWSRWQTFEEIFDGPHRRISALDPDKPVMIAETGCAEEGGSKGAWIGAAADSLRTMLPAVKAFVWFDIDKECDWRIASSRESLNSFKTHFTTW